MKKFCSALGMFLLGLGLLGTIINACCFDRGFYEREYEADQTAASIGMSEEDLMNATTTLLDYLQDERQDIRVEAVVNGYVRQVFNTRETRHMVDVKALYQNALKVMGFSWILGGLLTLYSLWKTAGKRAMLRFGYSTGLGLLMVCILAIGIACLTDFDAFWTGFHELFFDNDYWLLDPNTSIMINMFPGTFFFHLVLKIVLIFLAVLAAGGLLLWRLPVRRNA